MKKEDMRKKTCCFTGHRNIPTKEHESVKMRLCEAIISAIENGYRYFGAGGALGFDTLAAKIVLELKKQYPHIFLILVLPCRTQAKFWKTQDIAEYERIKSLADKIVYISEEYTSDCMFKRNQHLVDNSSLCICYLAKQSGGTAYTVRYAKTLGLNIVNTAI